MLSIRKAHGDGYSDARGRGYGREYGKGYGMGYGRGYAGQTAINILSKRKTL